MKSLTPEKQRLIEETNKFENLRNRINNKHNTDLAKFHKKNYKPRSGNNKIISKALQSIDFPTKKFAKEKEKEDKKIEKFNRKQLKRIIIALEENNAYYKERRKNIQALGKLYNNSYGNPVFTRCDWDADLLQTSLHLSIDDPRFTPVGTSLSQGFGENWLQFYIKCNNNDWITYSAEAYFFWDDPRPGLVNVFSQAEIYGTYYMDASWTCPAWPSSSYLDIFKKVTLSQNQGSSVLSISNEEAILSKSIHSEIGDKSIGFAGPVPIKQDLVDFNLTSQVPIMANSQVLVKLSITFDMLVWNKGKSELDFSSQNHLGINFPSVWITIES